MNPKKILILLHFSEGICGVWQRTKVEAEEFKKKGYEVLILSSNAIKGSRKKAEQFEDYKGVRVQRFPYIKLGGESYMWWNFKKQALNFNPDIIISHNYRQFHNSLALKIAKKIKKQKPCKTFLVTHAPFGIKRSRIQKIAIKLIDSFNNLNKFDRIISISKWEVPFLLKLGCKKEKIIHIPNSIPNEFFTQKKIKSEKKVLYLGRIHPRKDIPTLMKGFKNSVLERSYKLEIVGMAEKDYLKKLLRLKQEIKSKAEFPGPVFDLTKKIQKIDSVDFVVLPSLFEPFGIVFLESMARGKIVIATKTKGAQELILNNETGLLFDIKNNLQLSEIFNKISSKEFNKQKKLIQKNAMKFAEGFKVSNLIKKWEELF